MPQFFKKQEENMVDYKAGLSDRTIQAILDSGLNPETGNELSDQDREHYRGMLKPKEEPKKKKGWFRRVLGFKHGGSVKKYAKGGGVRKVRYK